MPPKKPFEPTKGEFLCCWSNYIVWASVSWLLAVKNVEKKNEWKLRSQDGRTRKTNFLDCETMVFSILFPRIGAKLLIRENIAKEEEFSPLENRRQRLRFAVYIKMPVTQTSVYWTSTELSLFF